MSNAYVELGGITAGGMKLGGANGGCGCAGKFLGGDELAENIADYEYTANSETLRNMANRVGGFVRNLTGGASTSEQQHQKVDSLRLSNASVQKRATDAMLETYAKAFGGCGIKLGGGPDAFVPRTMNDIVNHLKSLNVGKQIELAAVTGAAGSILKSLRYLSNILGEQINILERSTKSTNLEAPRAYKIAVATKEEIDRQISNLSEIMNVSIGPIDTEIKNLVLNIEEVTKLDSTLGSSEYQKKMKNILSSAIVTADTSYKLNEALKKFGKTMADYRAMKNVDDLSIMFTDMIRNKTMTMEQLAELNKALDVLQINFNGRDFMTEAAKNASSKADASSSSYHHGGSQIPDAGAWGGSDIPDAGAWGGSEIPDAGAWGGSDIPDAGAWGGDDNIPYTGGASSIVYEPPTVSEHEKSIKTRRTVRNVIIQAFHRQLNEASIGLVQSLNTLSLKIGTEIPITDQLDMFRNSLNRLRNLANSRDLYLALIGYYTDVSSKARKEEYVGTLNTVISYCETLLAMKEYSSSQAHFRGLVDSLKAVIAVIDKYTDDVLAKFGAGEHASAKQHAKMGGALEEDTLAAGTLPKLTMPRNKSSKTLDEALIKFDYYYRAAQIRLNLTQAGKDIMVYTEKYGDKVTNSIAMILQQEYDKYTVHKKMIENLKEDPGNTDLKAYKVKKDDLNKLKADMNKYTDRWWETKRKFWRTVEALDQYLLAFTNGIINNVDDVKEIKAMLDEIPIVSDLYPDGFATKYKDTTGANINKYAEMKPMLKNLYYLKNIVSIFVHVGSKFGGQELIKKIGLSPAHIYDNLVDYVSESFVQSLAMYDPGAAAPDRFVDDVSKVRAGSSPTNTVFTNADYYIVRAPRDNTHVPSTKDVPLLGWDFESEYFTYMLKAMCAKVFTVIGTYDMIDRPLEYNGTSAVRMILGGGFESRPKVDPACVELYLRLPLLLEFYRKIFGYDDKDGYKKYEDYPHTNNTALRISLIPDIDGTFSKLIKVIFRDAKFVKGSNYSDDDIATIIKECNEIYQKMSAKYANTEVIRQTINELVNDINRRYGVLSKDNHDFIEASIGRENYAQFYGATTKTPMADELEGEYEILEGESGSAAQPVSRAESMISGIINNAPGSTDIKVRTKISSDHYKLLRAFRCLVEKELASGSEQYSFATAIRSAKQKLTGARNDEDRFEVVCALIRGKEIYNARDNLVYLVFHETVVAGLNTLSGIHTILSKFMTRMKAVDLRSIMEVIIKRIGDGKADVGNADMQALFNEEDMKLEELSGANLLSFVFVGNAVEFKTAGKIFTDGKTNVDTSVVDLLQPSSYKNSAVTALFNGRQIMRELLESLYALSSDMQGLVDIKINNGRLSVSFNGLRKIIDELFQSVHHFIELVRPNIDLNVLKPYVDKETPGSYFWLQEQINEHIFVGRENAVLFGTTGLPGALSRHIPLGRLLENLDWTWAVIAPNFDHGDLLAEMVYYDANIADSGLCGSNESAASEGPSMIDLSNPYEALHFTGPQGQRVVDTRFIVRYKQLYSFGDEFTMNRSMLYSFNQLLAKFIQQFYETGTQKIYQGLINPLVNGPFSRAVMDHKYTYPDISPAIFVKGRRSDLTKAPSRFNIEALENMVPSNYSLLEKVVSTYHAAKDYAPNAFSDKHLGSLLMMTALALDVAENSLANSLDNNGDLAGNIDTLNAGSAEGVNNAKKLIAIVNNLSNAGAKIKTLSNTYIDSTKIAIEVLKSEIQPPFDPYNKERNIGRMPGQGGDIELATYVVGAMGIFGSVPRSKSSEMSKLLAATIKYVAGLNVASNTVEGYQKEVDELSIKVERLRNIDAAAKSEIDKMIRKSSGRLNKKTAMERSSFILEKLNWLEAIKDDDVNVPPAGPVTGGTKKPAGWITDLTKYLSTYNENNAKVKSLPGAQLQDTGKNPISVGKYQYADIAEVTHNTGVLRGYIAGAPLNPVTLVADTAYINGFVAKGDKTPKPVVAAGGPVDALFDAMLAIRAYNDDIGKDQPGGLTVDHSATVGASFAQKAYDSAAGGYSAAPVFDATSVNPLFTVYVAAKAAFDELVAQVSINEEMAGAFANMKAIVTAIDTASIAKAGGVVAAGNHFNPADDKIFSTIVLSSAALTYLNNDAKPLVEAMAGKRVSLSLVKEIEKLEKARKDLLDAKRAGPSANPNPSYFGAPQGYKQRLYTLINAIKDVKQAYVPRDPAKGQPMISAEDIYDVDNYMFNDPNFAIDDINYIRSPKPGEEGYDKAATSAPNRAYGNRMDPDGDHVLFTTLSIILRNIVTARSNNQVPVYLQDSIADVALFMKEKMRGALPGFKNMFTTLINRAEFIKMFTRDRTNLKMNRNFGKSKPNINPWPHVLKEAVDTAGDVRSRQHGILDAIIRGCTAMITACDKVLNEIGDEPKYMELYQNSIKEYNQRNGFNPVMPLSHLTRLLANTREKVDNDKNGFDVQYDEFLPFSAAGSDTMKFMYGARGLFGNYKKNPQMTDAQGFMDIMETGGIGLAVGGIDKKYMETFFGSYVKLLRYIHECRHMKGNLTVYVADGGDGKSTDKTRTEFTGSGKGNLYSRGIFTRNDFVITDTSKPHSAKGLAAGDSTNASITNYSTQSIVASEKFNKKIGSAAANDVPAAKPSYGLAHSTSAIVRMTESTFRDEMLKALVQYIASDQTGSYDLVVQNIIDLNITPINFHALTREIPLANLYNYAYTFDRMAVDTLYGLANETGAKVLQSLCDASGTFTFNSVKDYILKNIVDPYSKFEVHKSGKADKTYEQEIQALLVGTQDMVDGLARPKFLFDQIYQGILNGGTNLSVYTNTVRVHNDANKYHLVKSKDGDNNNIFPGKAAVLPSPGIVGSPDTLTLAKPTNPTTPIDFATDDTINSRFIRNLIFIVNLYRITRLKLQRDLIYDREIIQTSAAITNNSLTEFFGHSLKDPRLGEKWRDARRSRYGF